MTSIISSMILYNADILDLATKHDLILLDIDDVIITPTQYTCGSVWYGRYHANQQGKLTPYQLINNFYKCLSKTTYTTVSKQLIYDFTNLSEKALVLGFTARIIDFSGQTHQKIKDVGMKFSQLDISHPLIDNGCIYAGYNPNTAKPNNKGAVLVDLINSKLLLNIRSIMFIDDSLRNLQEVQQALEENIQFTGIHYTEVKTRLLCEYEEKELDDLGEYQLNILNQYDIIPSNYECFINSSVYEN